MLGNILTVQYAEHFYLVASVLKLKATLGKLQLVVVDPGEVLGGAVEEEA